ncbi:heme peroxidase [Coemansia javaensis]|uniref:Peroxidase n=1 Tax=Coemansia javaensis TaxID=2761396 RepID=A0A9W8HCH1_9FUNG|nr:heme peroxidase [Coemansia javaensis]
MSPSLARLAPRALARATARPAPAAAATAARALGRQQQQQQQQRQYHHRQAPRTAKAGPSPVAIGVLAAGALAGWYFFSSADGEAKVTADSWRKIDFQNVYKDIAALLEDEDYDDGSYGPVFVRLAWHASGTYDVRTKTGGSDGATIRFAPESGHGANAGLDVARARLEPLKKKYPHISYGDLYTLAGVVAVQELGGPTIRWRPGRTDGKVATDCTPDGRLPDAAQGASHVRDIFYRMGFNDQEIAALVGAHALGRCHTTRSGYDGPWNASPTAFTNFFYTELLDNTWVPKKWSGPFQYVDKPSGAFMMLPADMAFKTDPVFRTHVERYAADQDAFFADFAKAFAKLLELGVQFPADAPVYEFKALD